MSNKTIRATRGRRGGVLHDIANRWALNMDRLSREWCGSDQPCWYGERALLSVLAGAVWGLGGTAFEEYDSDKQGRRHGKPIRGREDLYFCYRRREYKAEAKHCNAYLMNTDKSRLKIRKFLDLAIQEVRSCSEDGQCRLGIVFAAPRVPKSTLAMANGLIGVWIDEAFVTVKCSAAAAVFPGSIRSWCPDTEKFAYPGIAMFIQRL